MWKTSYHKKRYTILSVKFVTKIKIRNLIMNETGMNVYTDAHNICEATAKRIYNDPQNKNCSHIS